MVDFLTVDCPLRDKDSPFYKEISDSSYIKYLCGRELKTLKKHPNFPTIKYLIVVKVDESKQKFRIKGRERKTKTYGIGILTTTNHYYFNFYNSKSVTLSQKNVTDIAKIVSMSYNINDKTEILFSDNISEHSEPINIYLNVVSAANGIRIYRKSFEKQLIAINYAFGYIKPKNGRKFYRRHYATLFKKLFKQGRFDFMQDHDLELMWNLMSKSEKTAKMRCAIGVLYLYSKSLRVAYSKKCIALRKEREAKEQKKI